MESDCTEEERTQSEGNLHIYYLVLGVPDGRPRLTSPAGWISHERAESSRERTRENSPLEDLPELVGLALADNQLQPVAESNGPALAAERGELADVIHIHDGIAVHPLKLRPAQAVLDGSQRLRCVEALLCRDDPNQFPLGLKSEHLIGIQQYIIGSAATDHLADPGGMLRRGDRGDAGNLVGDLDWPVQQAGGALHRFLQTCFGNRLEQVIDGSS